MNKYVITTPTENAINVKAIDKGMFGSWGAVSVIVSVAVAIDVEVVNSRIVNVIVLVAASTNVVVNATVVTIVVAVGWGAVLP